MADDICELLFKITSTDDGGLAKADAAIRKIASESGLTGQALSNLEKNVRAQFETMSRAGLNFEQIIRRIAQSGDTIGRGVGYIAKDIQKQLKDAADAASNLEKKQHSLQASSYNARLAITNPLLAVESTALRAATALGPVGIAIAGVGVAATLGGKALFDFVDAQGRAAQQTVNMAQRLGLTAGQMRTLEVEAKIAGVSTTSLGMSARYLAQALEDSSGVGKRSAAALKELGVSMQDASGHAREEGAVMLDTLEALSRTESQTKRTQLAVEAFGRGGSREIQNLIAEYGSLEQAAKDLGAGNTTELLESLKQSEEQINKMRSAWELFKAKLAEKISPIIIPIVTQITNGLASGPASSSNPIEEQEQGAYGAVSGDQPAWLRRLMAGAEPALRLSDRQLRSGLSNIGSYGLHVERDDRASDLLAGGPLTAQYEKNRSNTSEGRQQRLEEISTRLKAIADSFAKGGLGGFTAKQLESEQSKLERERQSLQNANSENSKRESLLRELQDSSAFARRHPDMAGDLESSSHLRRLAAERQRDLDIAGPGNRKLVDAKYGPQIEAAIAKLFEDIQKEAHRAADEAIKDQGKQKSTLPAAELDEFKQQLRQNVELSQYQYEQSQRRLKIIDTSDDRNIKRQESKDVRMAQLSAGDNSLTSLAAGAYYRVSDATRNRDEQFKEIDDLVASINSQSDKSLDDEKQLEQLTTQRLQVEKEYENEIADARMDAEIRIAEYRQQQLQSYKNEASSFYDSIFHVQNGRIVSNPRGLQNWFANQENDLLKGVFTNLTAPVFQGADQTIGGLIPGQTNPDGSKTAIGNLFKGTILDSDRAASPEIASRTLNTAAIDRLTAVMSGTSVNGQSASVASGSPADALSQFVSSGSTLTAGSPAEALTVLAGNNSGIAAPAASPTSGLSSLGGALGTGALLGTGIGSIISSLQNQPITSNSYISPVTGARVGSSSGGGVSGSTVESVLGMGALGGSALMSFAKSSGTSGASGSGALGGFMSGLTSGATDPSDALGIILNGNPAVWNPNTGTYSPVMSTSQEIGAGIGASATAATGALQAVNSFSEGGAKGIAGGVAATAGTAAVFDPEPVSKSILAGVAAASSIFGALVTTNQQIRQAQMANQIGYDEYVAPPTLNQSLDLGGYQMQYNKYGQISATPYDSVIETQPYKYQSPIKDPSGLYQYWETQPGQVIEPFSSGTPVPTWSSSQAPNGTYGAAPPSPISTSGSASAGMSMTLNVNALDSESILGRSDDIASAVHNAIRMGHPIGTQIQQAVLGT